MTNEQLDQQFERGFYNVPEPYRFRTMPGDVLQWREAESESGSRRQLAFAEEIAWRERWVARMWEVGFLLGPVLLQALLQALLKYFNLN